MATVKNISVKGYCDAVNNELSGMKMRITELREDLKKAYSMETDVYRAHDQHLLELAGMIEWKLQLLMKVCPFEWKGADEGVERTVSVGPDKTIETSEFSGGYLGG